MFLIQFGFKIEELQEWGKNKKLLWSSYQNIKNFDYDNISDKIYLTVNNFVNDQTYSYDKFASVSQAIAQLYNWLKAVNEYQGIAKEEKQQRRELIERLEVLQKKLTMK